MVLRLIFKSHGHNLVINKVEIKKDLLRTVCFNSFMDVSYLNWHHSHPLMQYHRKKNREINIMLLRIFTSHFISEQDIKAQLHFPYQMHGMPKLLWDTFLYV